MTMASGEWQNAKMLNVSESECRRRSVQINGAMMQMTAETVSRRGESRKLSFLLWLKKRWRLRQGLLFTDTEN